MTEEERLSEGVVLTPMGSDPEPVEAPVHTAAPAPTPSSAPAPTASPPATVAAPASEAEAPRASLPQLAQRVEFSAQRHHIDRAHLRDLGLIVPDGQVTALFEEFRIIKRQVLLAIRDAQRAGQGASAQRMLICSPLPGEGKTFCAANLALAIASEKDTEVVLVDADFAKPSVLSLFGLKTQGKGLMDALANPAVRVEDCVIPTDVGGLYVLPAGNQTTTDSEYLSSLQTTMVLERLTQGAPNRILIFDSPPALAASPAAELAKLVGQALVVARADKTGQSALEDALSLLSACPDIKLILNATHFSPSGRRFGAYYGYGE
ncbi:capsular biosynthesis protein [Altererythrobacter xixiisoli]|uniref:Capsular biosynthesis protein n=2 Tax=Croceibacterium xixiisoli TaxID=1476466 RepID=A0A6I4TXQ6_9SPHN|nr:capsular biosynthesis protein [Croceibacterium xixiisoli]